jgi:hypothetical protein
LNEQPPINNNSSLLHLHLQHPASRGNFGFGQAHVDQGLAAPAFADEEDPYANASAPYEDELYAYAYDDDDDAYSNFGFGQAHVDRGQALAAPAFVDEEDPYANASAPYEHELNAYDDDDDDFGGDLTHHTQGHGMWWEASPNDPTVPLVPVRPQPQALAHVETQIDVDEVLAKLPAALRYSPPPPPPLVFYFSFLFLFSSVYHKLTDDNDNNNSNATDLTQGRVWTTTTDDDDDDDDCVDDDEQQQQQQQVDAVLARLPASLRYASPISPLPISIASPLTLCFSLVSSVGAQQEHD